LSAALALYETASPAQRHQIARILRRVPGTFREWNERVTPTWRWDWQHVVVLQETLDKVLSGEIEKLIIQEPPRHGKSETATVRFPCYALECDPTMRVIIGAYNTTLAAKFGRKARKVAESTGLPLADDRAAADDWETSKGGGVRSVGVGAGITGSGGDLIIIDDPVKSREEAESETYRDAVWDWYTNDLYTRREPGAKMIVIMTRWHEDDLVGRILASDDAPNWTVLTLPALAEPNDPLGRPEGAALCPERYDEKALADIRLVMGEYAFGALYQQRPSPRTGNMFPRDKVEIIDAIPAGATKRVRYWDKAGTKDGGKYSAGVRMSYIPMGSVVGQGTIIIEDVVRGQWAADERNAVMQQTAKMDHGCPQKVEQEPGSGGKESAEFSVKLLAGSSVTVDRVTGDKVTRADPLSSQWKVGNVKLLRGDWNKAYLDEMEKAPNGTYVDQMDSSSGAFNHLVLGATPRVRSLS
jgi:predicted phage terminase large subunit-like protein